MAGKDVTEKALSWLRSLPRVSLQNLRGDPGLKIRPRRDTSKFQHGCGSRGSKQKQNYMPLGYETGNTPFYLRFAYEPYYKGFHMRRQYPPLSLLTLQKLIDTDRIDTSSLIDLATLCGTGVYTFSPQERHFGVNLTDEGINKFSAKVDIEVQWTTEPVIAAIEKLGGSVTLAYYDMPSLQALQDPERFFYTGKPIPRRLLPPEDIISDYINPKLRGYLADPQEIEYERGILAQKYGYELVIRDPPVRKDPRQVFLGLEPGWIVNLVDKTILKPDSPELIEYYSGPMDKKYIPQSESEVITEKAS
ncbi:UNVERIFIED_CONTAM: hypothetical protein PYX00_006496 [Menopon gallinae]|uniref:Large ribosomal subunit protein uL15m n=1 Tax=Menopon gallinae TaxID=328185 RepID=A0AAW2HVH2_9NEOP